MKVYVLRERWGRYTRSARAPEEKEIPTVPVVEAGVGFDMITWGDWALRPFAEKVIIYNFLAKVAIDQLGMYGPHAIHFINQQIVRGIAFEYAWGLWLWAPAVAVYGGIIVLAYYYSPRQVEFVTREEFPERYLMRYGSTVWAADLFRINLKGRPIYSLCYEIGNIIVGEKQHTYHPLGPADRWDTGYTWVQRRDRFMDHQAWIWKDVWAEFIGYAENIGAGLYKLRLPYKDHYSKEMPPGFRNPVTCQDWIPRIRVP